MYSMNDEGNMSLGNLIFCFRAGYSLFFPEVNLICTVHGRRDHWKAQIAL